ncbi:multidrug ABC transporter substrate-binding protein [Methyloceanibacter superfactus]|uniref:Multidrug ABC transporter substrate-binding protein n=1 Tax=Methyloceanibacter superfactus TaxID=1774969 RepID=A0A1E3VVS7_9HYPH|nr:ABC transporter permease [Methyloceanibacter superfactus]ODR97615.1 multidrug ABC transporter substrate-binding protein [Methyloceanibacter superfactus]
MFYETLKLAVQAIRRNALRSFLTLLGIVIGVSAVIAMVTIGNGTTEKVKEEMAKLGSNVLFVRPGQWGPGRSSATAKPFDMRDIAELRSQLHGVRAVAPMGQQAVTVVYGSESRSVGTIGTDASYIVTQDWGLSEGRNFVEGEIRSGRASASSARRVHEKLFGSTDAVGKRIRVSNVSCEVIGILEEKGESGFGTDRDDVVLMPIRTYQRRIAGNTDVNTINVSAMDGVDTSKVQADIERLLRERRGITEGEEDDFRVADMKQIADTQTATTGVLTALLGAVAGVSLLVGGIGIMNIMLVSVTERTREIGIRLAIGAQEAQVLMQFLVEAVVLSLLGGTIGVVLGLALAGAASAGMSIPFVLDPSIVVIAFGFSALIGVVFGYFPARRAAQLNPIEALRHE